MNAFGHRRVSGVTLIELMMGIVVLAVMLTIAVPNIVNVIKNNRVAAQTNEMIALFHFTRNEAIRRNDQVPIIITSLTDGWNAEVRDPLGQGAEPCLATGSLRCASYDQVQLILPNIDEVEDDEMELVFNSRGYLDRDGGNVTLWMEHENCSGTRQRRIIRILWSGQVEACTVACDVDACP